MSGTPRTLAEAIENGIREKDLPGHIRDFLSQGLGTLTLSEDEAVANAGEYLAKKWGLGKRKFNCDACQDQNDKCQECCPHDEHDHGICLDCSKDRTQEFVSAAEAYFEGER